MLNSSFSRNRTDCQVNVNMRVLESVAKEQLYV